MKKQDLYKTQKKRVFWGACFQWTQDIKGTGFIMKVSSHELFGEPCDKEPIIALMATILKAPQCTCEGL